MRKPKGVATTHAETRAANDGMMVLMRSAPEVLKDVMHEAKVAAAAIRRAGGGNCSDNNTPGEIWKQLTSHQKIKEFRYSFCGSPAVTQAENSEFPV